MIHKTLNKVRHHISHIGHHVGLHGRRHKKILKAVSEQTGLVYFGSVDQHNDEHAIIRGITASSTHRDSHMSVGSINGYDVQVVDRSDSIENHTGKLSNHHYIVCEIQLRKNHDLPHILVVPKGQRIVHFEGAFTTPHMQPLPLTGNIGYSHEFASRYDIKTAPTHFERVKQLLDPALTRTLAAHFWPLAIEFHNQKLYVYTNEKKMTRPLVENLIQNGLWLAGQIDSK
jgi:hypothetical protein